MPSWCPEPHVFVAMVKTSSNSPIDPTGFLRKRSMPAPRWVQKCDHYVLRWLVGDNDDDDDDDHDTHILFLGIIGIVYIYVASILGEQCRNTLNQHTVIGLGVFLHDSVLNI